jgi:hypothetical protein
LAGDYMLPNYWESLENKLKKLQNEVSNIKKTGKNKINKSK